MRVCHARILVPTVWMMTLPSSPKKYSNNCRLLRSHAPKLPLVDVTESTLRVELHHTVIGKWNAAAAVWLVAEKR
jgi:hypothetical protein